MRGRQVRKVLKWGPSDHKAFVQSLELIVGVWTVVATYNAAKNSGRKLRGIFAAIAAEDTEVIGLQEIKRKWGRRRDPLRALQRLGYETVYEKPEFALAWRPERWTYVTHHLERTSPVEYWTTNYMLVVILQSVETGELHRFISAHPPAHVQRPKHPAWAKVFAVLHDFADKIRRVSKRRPVRVKSTVIFMDLNVDVDRGWEPSDGWGFITDGPLKLVKPPEGTHGRRGIDVLMVDEDVRVAHPAA